MEKEHYIIINHEKIIVNDEIWRMYNANVNHIHYLARRNEACWARLRQMAACTGDCYTCPCYVPKGVSVNTISERNDSRTGIRGDYDPEMLMRCAEILADMARVDSDGDRIGRMIMEGWYQADIAAALGMPVSTYRDRLQRIGRMIREG